MAYQCFICHKGNWMGKRSQHHKGVAGGSWKHRAQKTPKLFKANLRPQRVMYADTVQQVKLCTDCISRLKQKKTMPVQGKILRKIEFWKRPQATA